MKKFILATVMCLFAFVASSQSFHRGRAHFKNVYTTIDTLVLQNRPSVYPTRDGDYLVELPKEQKLIIAYNEDHSKAIVLHGYPWARRMEFNVKYEAHRLILWYKDEHVYCGYIYDGKIKACQYVEAINENEKDRLVKRFPFFKHVATFTDAENNE